MLGDGDVAPGDGELVIGGEEADQAEGEPADGLGETEPVESKTVGAKPVEAGPGWGCYR